VFYRDFKDIFYENIGGFKNRPYPRYEVIKMALFKLFYLGYLVFLPVALTDHGLMTFFFGILGADGRRECHHCGGFADDTYVG
jgi:hypothetical protein